MKKVILLFNLLLIVQSLYAQSPKNKEKNDQFVAPFGSYLNGVGGLYGVAAGSKNVLKNGVDIYAGKSFGRVSLGGVLLSNIPLYFKGLTLSVGKVEVSSFEHEVSFTRGLSPNGTLIKQEIEGSGSFFGFDYSLIEDRLKLKVNLIDGRIVFKEFKTLEGETININRAAIHDITPNIKNITLIGELISKENRHQRSLVLELGLSDISGRIAQSDIRVWSLKAKGKERLNSKLMLNYTYQIQKTNVTRENGITTINGNCNSLNTNPDIIKACQGLEQDFDTAIVGHNRYGTAPPIGGSRGLRSFREFRFRAANTLLTSLEAEYQVFQRKKMNVNLVSFIDLGSADDEFSNIFKRYKSSFGIGARFYVNKNPIRLEAATGDEGESIFLALGKAW